MADIDPILVEFSNDEAIALPTGTAGRTEMLSPVALCGRAAGPVLLDTLFGAANENEPAAEGLLFHQLPAVIRDAVDEWALHLAARPWRWRREVMGKFAKIFADQFHQHMPHLGDDEVEGLKEIGFTCLLERLDDGTAIDNMHQARIYLDSVHDHHRDAARAFLGRLAPRVLQEA